MNRRRFLKGLGLPAGGAVMAGMTAATTRAREAAAEKSRDLSRSLGHFTKRMDRLDAQHRRLTRAVIAVGAISVGLDLSFLL